ncbi:MAG TPA: hypothetical protein VGR66_10295 [Candidatus Eisenbacteria bacterium]|nr:hypothetical protein [Candidatus Eisenbacteria bacterium]
MRVATMKQSVARGIRSGAFVLSVAALSVGFQAAAEAAFQFPLGHGVSTGTWAGQNPLQVSVKVGNKQAPLYFAQWRPDRWYVEAREGTGYQVKVRNTTNERIAFVISVDGLNAINGERSRLSSNEPMYVLDPYQSMTVKGWRRSMNKIAQFTFIDEEQSYASRTDQANGDMGWIRVAAFRERQDQGWQDEGQIRDDASRGEVRKSGPRPESSRGTTEPYAGAAPQSNPGTGWGGTQNDKVHAVDFDPERFACAQVIVRYEYRSGLVSLGILPKPSDRTHQRDEGQFGFALPPPR